MLAALWQLLLLLSFWSHPRPGHSAPIFDQPCPHYEDFAKYRTDKRLSKGRYQLPFQRPIERCRKFPSSILEDTLARLRTKIADPDLFRLFENTYPNTLDTAVLWNGFASKNTNGTGPPYTDEDLAFVITGDMYVWGNIHDRWMLILLSNAMWLRDSANQVLSYLPLLEPSQSPRSIAALFRGIINLQSRYIKISPYCHAFQPPLESGIPLGTNYAYYRNKVNPPYDSSKTFDCKWELDSLASFLHTSSEYYNATGDMDPFTKYSWVKTIRVILDAVGYMQTGTYTPDGRSLAA